MCDNSAHIVVNLQALSEQVDALAAAQRSQDARMSHSAGYATAIATIQTSLAQLSARHLELEAAQEAALVADQSQRGKLSEQITGLQVHLDGLNSASKNQVAKLEALAAHTALQAMPGAIARVVQLENIAAAQAADVGLQMNSLREDMLSRLQDTAQTASASAVRATAESADLLGQRMQMLQEHVDNMSVSITASEQTRAKQDTAQTSALKAQVQELDSQQKIHQRTLADTCALHKQALQDVAEAMEARLQELEQHVDIATAAMADMQERQHKTASAHSALDSAVHDLACAFQVYQEQLTGRLSSSDAALSNAADGVKQAQRMAEQAKDAAQCAQVCARDVQDEVTQWAQEAETSRAHQLAATSTADVNGAVQPQIASCTEQLTMQAEQLSQLRADIEGVRAAMAALQDRVNSPSTESSTASPDTHTSAHSLADDVDTGSTASPAQVSRSKADALHEQLAHMQATLVTLARQMQESQASVGNSPETMPPSFWQPHASIIQLCESAVSGIEAGCANGVNVQNATTQVHASPSSSSSCISSIEGSAAHPASNGGLHAPPHSMPPSDASTSAGSCTGSTSAPDSLASSEQCDLAAFLLQDNAADAQPLAACCSPENLAESAAQASGRCSGQHDGRGSVYVAAPPACDVAEMQSALQDLHNQVNTLRAQLASGLAAVWQQVLNEVSKERQVDATRTQLASAQLAKAVHATQEHDRAMAHAANAVKVADACIPTAVLTKDTHEEQAAQSSQHSSKGDSAQQAAALQAHLLGKEPALCLQKAAAKQAANQHAAVAAEVTVLVDTLVKSVQASGVSAPEPALTDATPVTQAVENTTGAAALGHTRPSTAETQRSSMQPSPATSHASIGDQSVANVIEFVQALEAEASLERLQPLTEQSASGHAEAHSGAAQPSSSAAEPMMPSMRRQSSSGQAMHASADDWHSAGSAMRMLASNGNDSQPPYLGALRQRFSVAPFPQADRAAQAAQAAEVIDAAVHGDAAGLFLHHASLADALSTSSVAAGIQHWDTGAWRLSGSASCRSGSALQAANGRQQLDSSCSGVGVDHGQVSLSQLDHPDAHVLAQRSSSVAMQEGMPASSSTAERQSIETSDTDVPACASDSSHPEAMGEPDRPTRDWTLSHSSDGPHKSLGTTSAAHASDSADYSPHDSSPSPQQEVPLSTPAVRRSASPVSSEHPLCSPDSPPALPPPTQLVQGPQQQASGPAQHGEPSAAPTASLTSASSGLRRLFDIFARPASSSPHTLLRSAQSDMGAVVHKQGEAIQQQAAATLPFARQRAGWHRNTVDVAAVPSVEDPGGHRVYRITVHVSPAAQVATAGPLTVLATVIGRQGQTATICAEVQNACADAAAESPSIGCVTGVCCIWLPHRQAVSNACLLFS